MAMHEIAKIIFEANVITHPQATIEYFEFNAPKWHRNGREYIYTKEEGLIKYTLQKTGNKLFVLTIEMLDLFNLDLGEWDEKEYPEREDLIKEAMCEIKQGLKCEIIIIDIKREVK